jgi:hypothetical protein
VFKYRICVEKGTMTPFTNQAVNLYISLLIIFKKNMHVAVSLFIYKEYVQGVVDELMHYS